MYATATMLRASIRSALKKYSKNTQLKNEEDHKTMRKQMTMNVFPFGNDGTDPALVIRAVII